MIKSLKDINKDLNRQICNCYEKRHDFDYLREKFNYLENNIKSIPFNCSRCKDNNFSISIKYEYPDKDELKELGFKDISNAFTWITISLTCNNCGKKYKKFIDFES